MLLKHLKTVFALVALTSLLALSACSSSSDKDYAQPDTLTLSDKDVGLYAGSGVTAAFSSETITITITPDADKDGEDDAAKNGARKDFDVTVYDADEKATSKITATKTVKDGDMSVTISVPSDYSTTSTPAEGDVYKVTIATKDKKGEGEAAAVLEDDIKVTVLKYTAYSEDIKIVADGATVELGDIATAAAVGGGFTGQLAVISSKPGNDPIKWSVDNASLGWIAQEDVTINDVVYPAGYLVTFPQDGTAAVPLTVTATTTIATGTDAKTDTWVVSIANDEVGLDSFEIVPESAYRQLRSGQDAQVVGYRVVSVPANTTADFTPTAAPTTGLTLSDVGAASPTVFTVTGAAASTAGDKTITVTSDFTHPIGGTTALVETTTLTAAADDLGINNETNNVTANPVAKPLLANEAWDFTVALSGSATALAAYSDSDAVYGITGTGAGNVTAPYGNRFGHIQVIADPTVTNTTTLTVGGGGDPATITLSATRAPTGWSLQSGTTDIGRHLELTVGDNATDITVTLTGNPATGTYTAVSSDTDVVTAVVDTTTTSKLTITPVAAGTAGIVLTSDYTHSQSGDPIKGVLYITVKPKPAS